MYLKISVLLLTCLICAESAPPKTDGLENEYRKAKTRLRIEGRGFNELEMADYAGISVPELREIARSIEIQNLENINSEMFKLLVNEIKKIKMNPRKEAQKELAVGSCNKSPLDAGLERLYSVAKSRLLTNGRDFDELEMAKYAGISVPELREIAHSMSIGNLENINLETFKLLVNEIKKIKLYTRKEAQKEGLEREYSDAKKKHVVPDERGLNELEMADYAGINVSELREIANSVSIKNLENINSNKFKLLMKAIKKKGGKTIKKPQEELVSGQSNTTTLDKDKGLEKAYRNAKMKLDTEGRDFNELEMADYAGISVPELREIANSISIHDLENINLKTFKLLVNEIKKIKSYTRKQAQKELALGSCRPALYEVFEREYNISKRKLDIPVERGFNEVEMAVYAGIDVTDLREIANSVSINNLDNINSENFKLLVNAIKKKRSKKPRGELEEAGSSNRSTLDEDGVIEAAYYACKLFLKVPNERYLNESEMAKFMEIDALELRKIANTIAIGNLNSIDLKTFKLLANAISKKRGVPIREPQGDLETFPSNRPILDEDEVLEMAYDIAKIHLGVPTSIGLNEYQMANHMGISVRKLKEIAKSISIENLDNINLKSFKSLAKKISEIKGVSILDF